MFIVTHNGHQSMSQLIIFQGRMQDDKELLKLEPFRPNCRPWGSSLRFLTAIQFCRFTKYILYNNLLTSPIEKVHLSNKIMYSILTLASEKVRLHSTNLYFWVKEYETWEL